MHAKQTLSLAKRQQQPITSSSYTYTFAPTPQRRQKQPNQTCFSLSSGGEKGDIALHLYEQPARRGTFTRSIATRKSTKTSKYMVSISALLWHSKEGSCLGIRCCNLTRTLVFRKRKTFPAGPCEVCPMRSVRLSSTKWSKPTASGRVITIVRHEVYGKQMKAREKM